MSIQATLKLPSTPQMTMKKTSTIVASFTLNWKVRRLRRRMIKLQLGSIGPSRIKLESLDLITASSSGATTLK